MGKCGEGYAPAPARLRGWEQKDENRVGQFREKRNKMKEEKPLTTHCCPCPPAAQRSPANAPAGTGSSAPVSGNEMKNKKEKKKKPTETQKIKMKREGDEKAHP